MDAIYLTKQIQNLPEGWETSPELYKQALSAQFTCEFDEEPCQAVSTPMDRVTVMDRGTRKEESLLWLVEVAAVYPIMDDSGRPALRRDGSQRTKRTVVERRIVCFSHKKRMGAAAREAGLQVREYPLHQNLRWLSDRAIAEGRRPLLETYYLAMAKGEATAEEGVKAGFIRPVAEPTDDCVGHYLSQGSEFVGTVSEADADVFHVVRMANRDTFWATDTFLFWGTWAKAKTCLKERQTEAVAKKAEATARKAEANERRAKAEEIQQKLVSKYAAVATPLGLKPPAVPDRDRNKRRERRDGPKPPRKPELTPSAREAIDQELEHLAEASEPATSEAEEPRGSQPPTLTASLGEIAVNRK